MQYIVPQNIDVEDRVVGPLSLRQFIIFLVGGGSIFFLFTTLGASIFPLFLFSSIILALATGFIAFFDYGGQKIESVIFCAFNTYTSNRLRIWRKDKAVTGLKKEPNTPEDDTKKAVVPKDYSEVKSELEKLATALDSSPPPTAEKDSEKAHDLFQFNSGIKRIEDYINKAKPKKKRDFLISEMASVSPGKNFEYPTIELTERMGVNER